MNALLKPLLEQMHALARHAHAQVESWTQGEQEPALLADAGTALEQLAGTARMARVAGVVLLAEEIRALLGKLDADGDPGKADALADGLVTLTDHMERMLDGETDSPRAVKDVVNRLRTARGEQDYDDIALFGRVLNMQHANKLPFDAQGRQGVETGKLKQRAAVMRKALAALLRGQQAGQALGLLARIMQELEQHATTPSAFRLWWVAGGFVEVLREEGLPAGKEQKRLLVQLEGRVRALADKGEQALERSDMDPLVTAMLYQLAGASSSGQRVTEIRSTFNLEEMLRTGGDGAAPRKTATDKLMRTVGAALREDLVTLRDSLDIYLRTGMQQKELLEPLPDIVRKSLETLTAVGNRDAVGLLEEVSGLFEREPDEATIDAIADRVLRVEDLIASELPRRPGSQSLEEALRETDFAKARNHLVSAGLGSLAQVKQSILEFSEVEDPALLEHAPAQLQEFAGTLRVAALDRIADLMDRVAAEVQALKRDGETGGIPLEALAEAMVCLEMHLEAMRDGQPARNTLVERAGAILEQDAAPPQAAPETVPDEGPADAASARPVIEGEPDPDMVEVFLEEAHEQVELLDGQFERLQSDLTDREALSEVRRAFHTLKGSGRMVGAARIGEFSWAFEQLLNRLLERADETGPDAVRLIGQGVAALPALVDQVESGRAPSVDVEALEAAATAMAKGERAAAPTTAATPLQDAVEVLRERLDGWLNAVERGSATGLPPAPLVDAAAAVVSAARTTGESAIQSRATQLRGTLLAINSAEQADVEALRTAAAWLVDRGQARVEPGAGDEDAGLGGLFLEEANDLLAQFSESFEAWQAQGGARDQLEAMQRALHTLKGISRTSGVEALGWLSHELESLLTRVAGTQPEDQAVSLVQRSLDRMFQMLDDIGEGRAARGYDDLKAGFERFMERAARSPGGTQDDQGDRDRRRRPRIHYEVARVRADQLDRAMNNASEVSVYRLRIEQQLRGFSGNLNELKGTIERLREQLRQLEMETEAQIVFQHGDGGADPDFDPLEMDRYSKMQQLSRSLMESVSDLVSLQGSLDQAAREAETLLMQQTRAASELQEGLMGTRMVPLHTYAERMRRVVRQTAEESGKKAVARLQGAEEELDRHMFERLIGPVEHLLRNAVVHGIETPEERAAAGKEELGTIVTGLHREASELCLSVRDDGRGFDLERIRAVAAEKGLLDADDADDERALQRLVLQPGFSTARDLTHSAGRGVGLDVVHSELHTLGGELEIDSVQGQGTTFTLRVPFTMTVTQSMLVDCGDERYAVPLPVIEGIVRMAPEDLAGHLGASQPEIEYGGERWRLAYIGQLLGYGHKLKAEPGERIPALLVQTGGQRFAVLADAVSSSQETIVKSLGPHLGRIPGLSGATILGDGGIVLILDLARLLRSHEGPPVPELDQPGDGMDLDPGEIHILVVDDSITVRRVTQRMLERRRITVQTARDGVEAVAALQERIPDAVLLDIEMPRMDGFEVASWMRGEPRFQKVPIIMITSRSGDKHRNRAKSIGVDRYLGKPYQEMELLQTIQELIDKQIKMTETNYPKDSV